MATIEPATAAPAASTPATPAAGQRLEIDRFFEALVRLEGSDLHMKVGQPPFIRVKGSLQPLKSPRIDDEQMRRLCLPMLDERRRRIPDFKGLFLPPAIERLCQFDQGLILLAGVTGSGKSTTIASMLNFINQSYRKHILTLEDPIEFVFTEDKCLINQREIGQDVKDFAVGMKHAVREDPDIILVGEMRDEETFMTAIHAAETGHLVFGTIHASSAATTITRILDLFPEEMHQALRSAMAFNMKGIVAQKLIRSIRPGVSRVPVVEMMFFDVMVRKHVLEGEDHMLADHIRKSHRDGMQDFTMSLKSLLDQGLIDRNDALEIAPNRDALMMAIKGIGVS